MAKLISVEVIATKILEVRGKKVMLDTYLARLYGASTKVFNQAVKRNKNRFPEDFMFQLTKEEVKIMVSQNVIPSVQSLGGYLPYVFTDYGVATFYVFIKVR